MLLKSFTRDEIFEMSLSGEILVKSLRMSLFTRAAMRTKSDVVAES